MAKGKKAAQDRTLLEATQAKPLLETKGPEADEGKETVSKIKESELVKP